MSEWWRGAVVYQIYPRSFQDSNGDGIGDLPGITQRLPYIAALGVDAIWLSPVFKSPMADMGYDVSDYCAIDPLFGSLEDFDTLLARAHELGLKVMMDQVISHSSDQHAAFVESRKDRSNPKADWYVWADPKPDGGPPSNWISVFGGPTWSWDSRRRQYYLHNFLASQPDFNFHNPDVQDYLLGTTRFWLERGVDGFRLDTVNYYFHDPLLRDNGPEPRAESEPPANPYDMQDHEYSKCRPENLAFLERMRALLDEYADRTTVGEVGEGPRRALRIMSEYTAPGRLHMAYSFDMLGPTFTPEHFRSRIEGFFKAAPDAWPMWAFSNHDVPRHVTRWADYGTQDQVASLSAALLLALEGTICLYQGEELGQTETDIAYHELTDPPGFKFWPDYKGRDGCRTPMVWDGSEQGGFTTGTPWLPVKAPQLARNVAAQEGAGTVLALYRALLAWRKTSALRDGRSTFFDVDPPALAFRRDAAEGSVFCAFNLSDQPIALPVSGLSALHGPHSGAVLSGNSLTLAPCGWVWTRCEAETTA